MFPKHLSAGENTYSTHLQGGAAAALPVRVDEPRFGEHVCHTPGQEAWHSRSAGQGYNSGREDTYSEAGWEFAACLLVLPHFCCKHVAIHENLLCMRPDVPTGGWKQQVTYPRCAPLQRATSLLPPHPFPFLVPCFLPGYIPCPPLWHRVQ